MRHMVLVLIGMALVGPLAAENSQAEDAVEAQAVTGTIGEVNDDVSAFTLLIGDGEEQEVKTFALSGGTRYVVNDEESTAAETLVPGATATVTYAGNQALSVEVRTDQDEEP